MKKIYVLMTTIVMMVLLSSCINTPTYTIEDIEDAITIGYASGDDQDHVTSNLSLPTVSNLDSQATITWLSDQVEIISHSGVVIRDSFDHDVVLVYSISYLGKAKIGSITVTVLADRPTIEMIADDVDIIYASGDNQSNVTSNLILPTVSSLDENATISWSSSNQSIISNDGVVNRTTLNEFVTLTYTVHYFEETISDSIFVVVLRADQIYTVSFNSNGGSTIEDVIQVENSLVTEPDDPTKEGYLFVAWYSDISLNSVYDFNTPLSSDMTLYAKWSLIEVFYTITFETNGGSAVSPLVSSNKTLPTIPVAPIKEDYVFKGWYQDQALTNKYLFNTPLTGDITLYAKWQEAVTTDFTGIYDGAEGLYEQDLIEFLYTVVTDNIAGKTQDYGDARYTLDDTDEDPNNANNVILVYLGTSVSGTWDGGATWNREHVWPQSLLDVDADNNTVNMASDLHNLKPANPSENSSRSNKWFGNETTSASYEPRDEVKGDVARILFYMAVRYYDVLTLVNLSGNQDPLIHQMGDLATLLMWNLLDPVDTFEMHRNDMIESYQGNRNPFVDYPEFATYIWG